MYANKSYLMDVDPKTLLTPPAQFQILENTWIPLFTPC